MSGYINLDQLYEIMHKAKKYDEREHHRHVISKMTDLRCSFCGKFQSAVEKLIVGPGVYICDECVELCSEILEGKAESREGDDNNE